MGTLGAVKAVSPDDLKGIGTQVIIANTYHLHLQPGEKLIEQMGGIHRFMGWNGPVITDSGGFQVFSLGVAREHGVGKIAGIFPDENPDKGGHLSSRKKKKLVQIDEDGVEFISYRDGSTHRFTPENVIQIQKSIGADIVLVLDECTSPFHDYEYTKQAMERTHRWAKRAHEEFKRMENDEQVLWGIVQGGAYRDLREYSAEFLSEMEFSGYAIGGSLGKSKDDMHRVLEWTTPILPGDKPRHLLGIGRIEDLRTCIKYGIDLFDCVVPTRMARTGRFLVEKEGKDRINIFNSRYKDDPGPIDEDCNCYTCRSFSRAYLRHLFIAGEISGPRLATIHNLHFVENLMKRIREEYFS